MALNVLVTGGYGRLGKHLCPLLKSKYNCYIPTKKQFNILYPPSEIKQFDIIFNLAGYTNVPQAEKDPALAQLINVDGLDWLINKTDPNTRIVHISTDYVYNGDIENSKEEDILEPFNNYGRSKAQGDIKLLNSGRPNILIIRTSFKDIKWPYKYAFNNVITNADYVDIIAEKIDNFVYNGPRFGIYNLGTEAKSIYQLAKIRNPYICKINLNEEEYPYLRKILTMDLSKSRSFLGENNA